MRIISGNLKSRIINVPKSIKNLRPTTDRARETLFNILAVRFPLGGKTILDIYCGSGSFGIECISRGSSKCYFVDIFPKTAKDNIANLGIEANSIVIKNDSVRFLKSNPEIAFDLAFADPPYEYKEYDKFISEFAKHRKILILEHSDKFIPNEKHQSCLFLRKVIGISIFSFFDFKEYNEE
ncbi:MAG: RsmD family RNA methyltransferase [Ignavibacteria bacterium]|nr:RsmD family RNA methyltransferase [Ignavibacteria bacterium]